MITGKYIYGNDNISDCLAIRNEVFTCEQGVPAEEDQDGMDECALHVLVMDDGEPAATGRMFFDGERMKLGRMCVRREYRNKGLGDLTVRMLLYKFLQMDIDEVELSAQLHAKPFYERFGFEAVGGQYMEAGIPHVKMRAKKEHLVLGGCNHGACAE